MTQGLIIVDVQNDYFAGGSMELVAMDEAAAHCRVLLDAFRADSAHFATLVCTIHCSRPASTNSSSAAR